MSRVIPEIIERHVDEASFLWERRMRACCSPLFDLPALAEHDERLEANLEGINIARDVGIAQAMEAFGRSNAASELFVAAHATAEQGDAMAFARLLVASESLHDGDVAMVSALEWLSQGRADTILRELLGEECPPHLHRLGIAGYAARRQDPGDRLRRALYATDPLLRSQAFRAVGELGRRDLLGLLRAEVRGAGHQADPWAVWSAVFFGDTSLLSSLWQIAEGALPAAEVACDLAVRCVSASEAASRLEALSRSPDTLSVALSGAAARGDPVCIPWVLDVVETRSALARKAAWVYATITGVVLEPPLAMRIPSDPPSEEALMRVLLDPYEDLPTPQIAALRAHWAEVRSRFVAGERRLGGRVIEPAWLEECLRVGKQPWRASAAVEMGRAALSGGIVPIGAPLVARSY